MITVSRLFNGNGKFGYCHHFHNSDHLNICITGYFYHKSKIKSQTKERGRGREGERERGREGERERGRYLIFCCHIVTLKRGNDAVHTA